MALKTKIGPNFSDHYEHQEGSSVIRHWRTRSVYGGPAVFKQYIDFDSPEEAAEYFDENCGG
jgi:hypothetical protein